MSMKSPMCGDYLSPIRRKEGKRSNAMKDERIENDDFGIFYYRKNTNINWPTKAAFKA